MDDNYILGSKYYRGNQRHRKKAIQEGLARADRRKENPKTIDAYILKLRSIRLGRGMTQKQAAKLLRTRQPVISRLENGHTTPTVSFLNRYAKVLDVTITIKIKL